MNIPMRCIALIIGAVLALTLCMPRAAAAPLSTSAAPRERRGSIHEREAVWQAAVAWLVHA